MKRITVLLNYFKEESLTVSNIYSVVLFLRNLIFLLCCRGYAFKWSYTEITPYIMRVNVYREIKTKSIYKPLKHYFKHLKTDHYRKIPLYPLHAISESSNYYLVNY